VKSATASDDRRTGQIKRGISWLGHAQGILKQAQSCMRSSVEGWMVVAPEARRKSVVLLDDHHTTPAGRCRKPEHMPAGPPPATQHSRGWSPGMTTQATMATRPMPELEAKPREMG